MSERRVAIVTDAAADLPSPDKLKSRFGVDPINQIPLAVTFGDDTYMVGSDFGYDQFRQKLAESDQIPKTGALGPDVMLELFNQVIGADLDLLTINIGDKFSSTGMNVRLAASELGNRATAYDSQTVSMAQGYMAIAAERLATSGANRLEIIDHLDDLNRRTSLQVITPNMEFLRASGRVSHLVGILGGALKIVPILQIDHNRVDNIAKVRTVRGALDWMLSSVTSMGTLEWGAVLDFEAESNADDLYARLVTETNLPQDTLYRGKLGPLTASHGGPGTIAVVTVKAK